MNNYKGVIIEESLENKSVFRKVKVLSTKVEKVTRKHKTPWLKKWTLHTVEVSQNQAKEIAEKISQLLDSQHDSSWYADFCDNAHHYIIFRKKIFFIDRNNQKQYDEAKRYGLRLGIPEYQVNFHSEVASEKDN